MTYTERSKKCIKCWQPWSGWGIVCNECRQIEKLDTIANTGSRSHGGTGSSSVVLWDPSWSTLGFILLAFLLVNAFTGWVFFKVIWWLFKVIFFLAIGMWIGMDI